MHRCNSPPASYPTLGGNGYRAGRLSGRAVSPRHNQHRDGLGMPLLGPFCFGDFVIVESSARNAHAPWRLLSGHDPTRRKTMPNVYVEARPKGRPGNSPIEDYVVEDHADHVLATFKDRRGHRLGAQGRP